MSFLAIWLALSAVTGIFVCRLFAVSGPQFNRRKRAMSRDQADKVSLLLPQCFENSFWRT
jgi:hypothetical protein